MESIIFFITQLAITLVTIFLRGIQTQNVVNGEYKQAAITSILMSIANVIFIGLIAIDPIRSLVPTAIGSALGVTLSMKYKRV